MLDNVEKYQNIRKELEEGKVKKKIKTKNIKGI